MDQAQRAAQIESNEVLYDVADHIAVITLNAPERMNTISGPMLNDLTRLLIRAVARSRRKNLSNGALPTRSCPTPR